MKKTLVIGCQGFIGRHLWKRYGSVAGTHRTALEGVLSLDLISPNLEKLPLDWSEYSHAIITSAISKISVCEKEKEETYRCNVEGTLSIAHQLTARGLFPIFFSSDYVFDGTASSYDETSPLNPLNEYGRQKTILEQEIPKICGTNHLILRLGKVFSLNFGDQTLLDEMASSLCQKKTIRAAYDQIFSPIFIEDVINGVLALQKMNAFGLYHLCGNETWSRYDLACKVARFLQIDQNFIDKISLDDLNESFKRPKKIIMKNDKFKNVTGLSLLPMLSCIEKISNFYKEKSFHEN